jgi:hypothetical protein
MDGLNLGAIAGGKMSTFRVVGEKMVEAGPDQKVKAWLVETDDNGPMTFWLTKQAPYVIKLS